MATTPTDAYAATMAQISFEEGKKNERLKAISDLFDFTTDAVKFAKTIVKTKQDKLELDTYASDNNWFYDKSSDKYYTTLGEGEGFKLGSMSTSQMKLFSTLEESGLDTLDSERIWTYKDGKKTGFKPAIVEDDFTHQEILNLQKNDPWKSKDSSDTSSAYNELWEGFTKESPFSGDWVLPDSTSVDNQKQQGSNQAVGQKGWLMQQLTDDRGLFQGGEQGRVLGRVIDAFEDNNKSISTASQLNKEKHKINPALEDLFEISSKSEDETPIKIHTKDGKDYSVHPTSGHLTPLSGYEIQKKKKDSVPLGHNIAKKRYSKGKTIHSKKHLNKILTDLQAQSWNPETLDIKDPRDFKDYISIQPHFKKGQWLGTSKEAIESDSAWRIPTDSYISKDELEFWDQDAFIDFFTINGETQPVLITGHEKWMLDNAGENRDALEEWLKNKSEENLKTTNQWTGDYERDPQTGLYKFGSGLMNFMKGVTQIAPGISAVLGVGQWLGGAHSKAKANRSKMHALRKGISAHIDEMGETTRDYGEYVDSLTEGANIKMKNLVTQFGDTSDEFLSQYDMLQKKAGGLITSQTDIKEETLQQLTDTIENQQEQLNFEVDSAYDEYVRTFDKNMRGKRYELDDMQRKYRYARNHRYMHQNLFG